MKVKVPVLNTVNRVVIIDTEATVGAQIGTDLRMPDGTLATAAKLASYLGVSASSSAQAHRLLTGLSLGDDHPQYTRKDTLTTRGDLYVRGVSTVQRLALGTSGQLLRSDGTDAQWATLSPTITLGTDLSGNVTLADLSSGTLNATIVSNAVTDDKLRDSVGTSVIGRSGGTTGDPADIVAGADNHLLRRESGVLGFGQITDAYVSNFDEAAQDAVGGILTDTSEIDFTYDDATPTITASLVAASVAFSKIQNISTSRFLGRITASSGSIEVLTGTQATTLLDVFTSGLQGVVPASGGGTANFLRADGTWAAPSAGSGTVTDIAAGTGLSASPGSPITTSGTLSVDQSFSPTWTGTHTFNQPIAIARTGAGNITTFTTGSVSGSLSIDHLSSGNVFLTANAAADLEFVAGGRVGLRAGGVDVANFQSAGLVMAAGQIYLQDGTATNPALTFVNDQDTGLYRLSANRMGFTSGGAVILAIDSSLTFGTGVTIRGQDGTVSLPFYAFDNDTNTGWYRRSSDNMGAAAGGVLNLIVASSFVEVSTNLYVDNFLYCGDGSVSTPGVSFYNDTNTGVYRSGSDALAFATGGAQRGRFENTFFRLIVPALTDDGSVSVPSYSFINDTDTGMYRIGANTLGFAAGSVSMMQIAGGLGVYFTDGSAGTPSISFINDQDTGIYRHGVDAGAATAGGVASFRWDSSVTGDDTRFLLWDVTAGIMKRVIRGPADSGGTGFRLLRIAN